MSDSIQLWMTRALDAGKALEAEHTNFRHALVSAIRELDIRLDDLRATFEAACKQGGIDRAAIMRRLDEVELVLREYGRPASPASLSVDEIEQYLADLNAAIARLKREVVA